MMKVITANYLTLKECISSKMTWSDKFYIGTETTDVPGFINSMCGLDVSQSPEFTDEITSTMLFDYLIPIFADYAAVVYWDDDNIVDAVKDWSLQLCSMIKHSYGRHSLLIKNFEAHKNELMKRIESTTQFKYNDTPQNAGNWSDDDHVSNQTETTVAIDGDTIIGRISEINKKLRDLYQEWAMEFRDLFIDSAMGDIQCETQRN